MVATFIFPDTYEPTHRPFRSGDFVGGGLHVVLGIKEQNSRNSSPSMRPSWWFCCGCFFCLFLAPRIIPLKRNKETKLGNKNTPNLYRKTRKTTFFENLRMILLLIPRFFRVEMSCLLGRLIIVWRFSWDCFNLGQQEIRRWGPWHLPHDSFGKNDTFAAVPFQERYYAMRMAVWLYLFSCFYQCVIYLDKT